MNKRDLYYWFEENISVLETNYIQHKDPRKQSGFSGSLYKWTKCRKPIADCIDKSGSLLDIGCANGYLLQSIMKWKNFEGINVVPYGLDIGEKLLLLAKKRLPAFAEHFFHGNILNWKPPIKFDYVHTELVYVPAKYRRNLINRLLKEFLKTNGKLILCEYLSSKINNTEPGINDYVEKPDYSNYELNSVI